MTPSIELQAPDLARWRDGNTGVEHVFSFDSGRTGPHVMVQALTHGNELCGAIALDWLLGLQREWAVQRGRLTLAFANLAAYTRWNPANPDASRCVDEDYNRVWADEVLLGTRDSVELRRARELRRFVDDADWLLDIHSMREPCPPLMVCGTTAGGGAKGAALARRLRVPEWLLIDTGHPAGLRMIERGRFGDPADARTAILIECGQHWERAAADVACDALLRFLAEAGTLDAAFVARHLPRFGRQPAARQRLVRVTEAVVAKSLDFRFVADFRGLEVVAKAGDPIAVDAGVVIRAPYDRTVLVMPGTTNLKVGNTVVRLGHVEDE